MELSIMNAANETTSPVKGPNPCMKGIKGCGDLPRTHDSQIASNLTSPVGTHKDIETFKSQVSGQTHTKECAFYGGLPRLRFCTFVHCAEYISNAKPMARTSCTVGMKSHCMNYHARVNLDRYYAFHVQPRYR